MIPKEKMMKILLENRCTKAEAERYINNDHVIIYEDPEDWLTDENVFREESGDPLITLDDAREGKIADISMVNVDDHEYLIQYIL